MSPITLVVNGRQHSIEADPQSPLLWILRDNLGLTGTKFGCGIGVCGACTVHLNGDPVRSCLTRVGSISSAHVVTIEGLSKDRSHPIQRAWIADDVPQCGYCQPGMIMSAAALLRSNPKPSDAEIDETMSRHICRCGTYQRIRQAIHRAAGGVSNDHGH